MPPSVKVVSSIAANGVRSVVVTRPAAGQGPFPIEALTSPGHLNFITAIGSAPTFSYHKTRAAGTLLLGTVGASTCFCKDPSRNSGTIGGLRFNPGVCAPFPVGELQSTHNPICNITEYNGGLYCCHDKSVLLDADQQQPLKSQTWRMKYRFWFEEAQVAAAPSPSTPAGEIRSRASSHVNTFRVWWSTEAYNNEYDIPKSKANCLDPLTGGPAHPHRPRPLR